MSVPQTILRRSFVHWLTKVDAKGWVANHDGNLSQRLPGGRLLATPTSFSKGEIREEDLLVLDLEGRVRQGRHKVFSEIALHLRCFAARPDVNVVLHAHPPTSTGFAVAGVEVDPCILAESIVSLGDRIPLVPYGIPGSRASEDALADHIARADAVLLENHGVITVGNCIEQAFLRMELVEHLARIQSAALQVGTARRIPAADIQRLMDKRIRAGLGPPAAADGPTAKSSEASPATRVLVGPCSGPRTVPALPRAH
jgi:L-fuculose-phosphate aldolase